MTEKVAADFLPDELPANPMSLVESWLADANAARHQPNGNAMTLATCDTNGQPSARIVLCKGFNADLGVIDFYTNYLSRKAREIDANHRVSLTFHWDHQSRQVRIEGVALKTSAAQSDAYFASRPRISQIGAWASEQSQPISSRTSMIKQFERRSGEYEASDTSVPRPPHWGGYRVWASACELWVEGSGRVHDRARFERSVEMSGADECDTGQWHGTRLQP